MSGPITMVSPGSSTTIPASPSTSPAPAILRSAWAATE